MATTAKKIFDLALALMDEPAERADAYEGRALSVINVLCGEVYPFSEGFGGTGGKRTLCPPAEELSSAVGPDDWLARCVLPYGLAAQLLLDENPAAASFFQQRYEELLSRSGRGLPAASEEIANLYGGLSAGEAQ